MNDYCQSCGMPMNVEGATYGLEKDGTKSKDYCKYCYINGEFNNPDETMNEMIESCVPHMILDNPNMSKDEARKNMKQLFPTLKRWKV